MGPAGTAGEGGRRRSGKDSARGDNGAERTGTGPARRAGTRRRDRRGSGPRLQRPGKLPVYPARALLPRGSNHPLDPSWGDAGAQRVEPHPCPAERQPGAAGGGRVPGRGSSSARWTPCAGRGSLWLRPPSRPAPQMFAVPIAPGPGRADVTAVVGSWQQALNSKTLHPRRPCPGTDVPRSGAERADSHSHWPRGASRGPGEGRAPLPTTGPGVHWAACPSGRSTTSPGKRRAACPPYP